MNLIEAWEQAKPGQKIRRQSWPEEMYIFKDAIYVSHIKASNSPNMDGHICSTDLCAYDWKVAKEKKKVVIDNITWKVRTVSNCNWMVPFGNIKFAFSNIKPDWLNKEMKMTLEWVE